MKRKQAKHALALRGLGLFPQSLRQAAAADKRFRDRFDITLDATITVGPAVVSFRRSAFFQTIRRVHADRTAMQPLADVDGNTWSVGIRDTEGSIHVSLGKGQQTILLPDFFALDCDRSRRLSRFDLVADEVNFPEENNRHWRGILKRRTASDEEVGDLDQDLLNTPARIMESILDDLQTGHSNLTTLVPPLARYYERLSGHAPKGTSIDEFASGEIRQHIAQLIEWNPIQGARQALLLAGHQSIIRAMDESTIARIDLADLAEWAREADPISQLGMLELGIRVLPDQRGLEEPLVEIVRQLLTEDPEPDSSRLELLSSCFVLVEGELSRTKILDGEPPFRRRLASLAQASLICRLVTGKVDTARFGRWAWEQRSYAFFCQTLVDLRLEPRWMPDLANASQLYNELIGRLVDIAGAYESTLPDGPLRALLLGDGDGALRKRITFTSFWPGPLEGARSKLSGPMPDEISALIRESLTSPTVEPKSFFALVNARAFSLDPDFIDLAISSLKGAKYRLLDEDTDALVNTYFGLAAVAASERRPDLAAELRILVRRGRRDLGQQITPLNELRIALTAAAAHADLLEWSTFFGNWGLELAHGEISSEDADQMLIELDQLLQAEPELAAGVDRARAALSAFIGM